MAETTLAGSNGNVWRVLVTPGDVVDEEDPVVILESMTIEIPVVAAAAGVVVAVHVSEGDTVSAGQPLIDLSRD